jgi:hypothetical protein
MTTTKLTTRITDHAIEIGGFRVVPTGLQIVGAPTFQAWEAFGSLLNTVEWALQFAVGDWLNYGEDAFGEKAAQVVDAERWDEQTLRVYRWTAAKVPPENRRIPPLTFTHHMAVAHLPADEQVAWLEKAIEGGGNGTTWSVADLKRAVKRGTKDNDAADEWLVVIYCAGQAEQEALVNRLTTEGLRCKGVVRAAKPLKELEA